MELLVNQIEECSRIQVRQRNDAAVVNDYAEAMIAGADFPPIVVFQEQGTERYIVSDGHHRLMAARQAQIPAIDVKLIEGDETAALEHALGANHHHGLRLNKADRERAVSLLMTDARIKDKYRTDQDRAELLGVSLRTFRGYKSEWRTAAGGSPKERAAKGSASRSAEKNTPNRLKNNINHNKGLGSDAAELQRRKQPRSIRESDYLPAMSSIMQGHLLAVNTALEALERIPYTGKDFVDAVGVSRISAKAISGMQFVRQVGDALYV